MLAADIGELAARSSLVVHELTPLRASLEDAFMELTADAVEYRSTTDAGHAGAGSDARGDVTLVPSSH
jgi:ABC-2 type transport system ATP-binding protein